MVGYNFRQRPQAKNNKERFAGNSRSFVQPEQARHEHGEVPPTGITRRQTVTDHRLILGSYIVLIVGVSPPILPTSLEEQGAGDTIGFELPAELKGPYPRLPISFRLPISLLSEKALSFPSLEHSPEEKFRYEVVVMLEVGCGTVVRPNLLQAPSQKLP